MRKSDKVHISLVSGGQFQSGAVRRRLDEFNGKVCEVIIREQREYRSLASNADYYGNVVAPIAEQLRIMDVRGKHGGPVTDQQVHKQLAEIFLLRSRLLDPTTGEYEDYVPSTSELTIEEFAAYKARVIAWAYDFFGPDFTFPERHEYQEFTLA
jgi:hypothetical protein